MGCISSTPEARGSQYVSSVSPEAGGEQAIDSTPTPVYEKKSQPQVETEKSPTEPAKAAMTTQSSMGKSLIVSKLRTDCKIREAYKLGKVLGTGGFSIVKMAVDKLTGTEYACKIMALPAAGNDQERDAHKDINTPCENTREDIFKEINILCGLNHENVLLLKEYFEEHNKVFIITELLTGGELLEAVLKRGCYNESEARTCFVQLLRGIEYLHNRGVVHRDLKLENLLLKTTGDITVVKIADFGLAKRAAGDSMHTICGTPQYVAPEVIMGLTGTNYGPAVDMWGAGVVLFILLGGYPPFYSESEPALFDQIRKGKFEFDDPVWAGITAKAKDLIQKLLVIDPSKRLTASEALQHPWLAPEQVDPKGPALTGTRENLQKHFSTRKALAANLTPLEST